MLNINFKLNICQVHVMVWVGPSFKFFDLYPISRVTLLTYLGFGCCTLPTTLYQFRARWLKTVMILKVKFTKASSVDCIWRRLQVNEQQSERQKKNVLQKVLTFSYRAVELCQKDVNVIPKRFLIFLIIFY